MRPQTIVERLDFVAKRIPGLKFTPPTQLQPNDQGYDCFMSCDMYYIEIKIDQSQKSVKDVVISHGNNSDGISCPVLRKVLGDQDFETFAKHLSGLHSIYQITTNDKKVKQRAYPALSALEQDLTTLYEHQRRRVTNCHELVHKSPIGIMEPRKGGLPVRLTYFITPYDLVDTTQRGLINLNVNNIIDKNLGLSATVEIEGSSPHKLQIKSLITSQQNTGLPAYSFFNSQNSEKLPAQFVLNLSQPFPMLNTSISQLINELNSEPSTIKEYLTNLTSASKESLVGLIARQELDLNKGPFCRSVDVLKGADSDSCDLQKHVYSIKLLDQYHTYHILDNYLERHDGVYVNKIPFTHPTSIPTILKVLRAQALFNFFIGSCIRRSKSSNVNNFDENATKLAHESNIFDIIPVNLNNICISFEHPSKESLATLEINFKELSCQLYALDKESVCSNEFATKVLQKCWSIPVTLRSVLKKCDERRLALLEDANKRRERELQELLTNNSNQQGLQYKSHLQYQETLLQSKFNNLHDTSNSRDLNSITEFLSSKINYASTSDASNQTNTSSNSANHRSNLLKKYSCKPKAKQNVTTKNQTGNKILSLMLKRQNSTPSSIDDSSLKATLTKKAKIKILTGDTNTKHNNLNTTKLISTDAANAARLASKQAKQQGSNNQNASLSLIRSPNKAQALSLNPLPASTANPNASLTGAQTPATSSKQFETPQFIPGNANNSINRAKSQINGNNAAAGKSRKSSIGAVLDKLVGGVTPEQQSLALQLGSTSDGGSESSKNSPLGAKTKTRTPATDQFAIKQGTVGSLKLTVTKTKPTTATSSSLSASSSASNSSSASSSASIFSSSTSNSSSKSSSDVSKLVGIGAAPNIKYTIPKISKTQQASANQTNSSAENNYANSNANDPSQQGDDSSNPSSSASAATSSTAAAQKRTTSTPFNRANNSNRNPVSSSTHPRTTSNPLASASRPSSTSNNTNDNHSINRPQNSNANQQSMRQQQQINNRMVNLQQHPALQRMVNPNILANPQQQQQQQHLLPQQPLQPQHPNQAPMFALGLPQGAFQNPNDLNILAQNQAAALLNQQRNQMNLNPSQQMSVPNFMSSSADSNLISSSGPQFAAALPQQISLVPSTNNITGIVGDSLQRPTPSAMNNAPQFYIKQPKFDEPMNTVSSTPRLINEASQSTFADRNLNTGSTNNNINIHNPNQGPPNISAVPNPMQQRLMQQSLANATSAAGMMNVVEMSSSSGTMPNLASASRVPLGPGGQGVTSSSDAESNDLGPTMSTPSSPTECSHVETVAPPPLIPIDSLEEPQAISPDLDHPDDASDRLSIVDLNENIADSISNAADDTLKPSGTNSPSNAQDSNSATPSSSSTRPVDSTPVIAMDLGGSSMTDASNNSSTTTTNNNNTTTTASTSSSNSGGGNVASTSNQTEQQPNVTAQSPASSTTNEALVVSATSTAQLSSSSSSSNVAPSSDETTNASRNQPSNPVMVLNDEPIGGPQSSMAATTSDMI